jgi:DNA invertase Pin-like site-specific DNA recombinase
VRAVGYTRVSSEEQESGFSLGAQEQSIRAFCVAQGWGEPAFYTEAVSAWTDDIGKRPAFRRLLDDAGAGLVDAAIVWKLDRWARDVVVCIQSLRDLDRRGIRFVSLTESIDLGSAWGRAMAAFLAIFAELSSGQTSERVRLGLARKRAAGGHTGGIPYGARRVDGRLAPHPETAEHLVDILAWWAGGQSGQWIASELNRRGVAPHKGGACWRARAIYYIVRRGDWLLAQPAPWPERWAAAAGRPQLPRVRAGAAVRELSGLMRCACGGGLQYGHATPGGGRVLACNNPHLPGRPSGYGCPHRRRTSAHYERQVAAAFLALRLHDEEDEPAADLGPALADLAERRQLLGVALADRAIRLDDYRARLRALDREGAALPRGERRLVAGADLARAQAGWPLLTPAARNRLYRLVIERVEIDGAAARVVWLPWVRRALGEG